MILPMFPQLPGQGFARKAPVSATIIASHESGREARAALYGGLYEFEVGFDALVSDDGAFPGLPPYSLAAVLGLYLQCRGGFGSFLFIDPNDGAVNDQQIATGDGATTRFELTRSLGPASDADIQIMALTDVTVGGAAVSGFALAPPHHVALAAPPPTGAAIRASFTYAFVCRFLEDAMEFENFAQSLWSTKSVKFRSLRR